MRSFYTYVCICAFFLFVSCKKDNSSTVKITSANSGGTVQVNKGATIFLSLGTATDGGFQANDPQFDGSILKLNSHTYTPPPATGAIGASGTDNWQFTALKSGSTTLKVTESQNHSNTIVEFSGTITVN